jgi:hypothetical protein
VGIVGVRGVLVGRVGSGLDVGVHIGEAEGLKEGVGWAVTGGSVGTEGTTLGVEVAEGTVASGVALGITEAVGVLVKRGEAVGTGTTVAIEVGVGVGVGSPKSRMISGSSGASSPTP